MSVPVSTMRRGDPIRRPKVRAHSGRRRLLPYVEVEKAADFALRVGARRFFLEAADGHHLAIELEVELVRC